MAFPCKFQKSDLFKNSQKMYLFQQQIITTLREYIMNLAVFLHNSKQQKDSILPLPLSPLYVLPHQKWYFSSKHLTPLRKRKENTSLFKYLFDNQTLSQRQGNNSLDLAHCIQEIFVVYEKNDYFDNKMKHIFDVVYDHYLSRGDNNQKCSCQCRQIIDQSSSRYFITSGQTLNKCFNISKKNAKNRNTISNQENINWYEFTKNLIRQQLNIQSHSIPQQALYLYKLPEGKDTNSIFNVLWNDNYVIFNNGNKLEISQNMKSKAAQLCQYISKKLNQFIWKKIETYIPFIAQELLNHQIFNTSLKNKAKIYTFRVWFCKDDTNNLIYLLNLSHITLKGVQCALYHEFNVKMQTVNHQATNNKSISNKFSLRGSKKSFINKQKSFSVCDKSYTIVRRLLESTELKKVKNKRDQKDSAFLNKEKIHIEQEQPNGIQCQCCENLLTSEEWGNQITANHLEQTRYLRQIKIGKIQCNPYQFVKVCTLCYKTYLQNHRRNSMNQQKRSQSARRSQNKNSRNLKDKPSNNYTHYKSKQNSVNNSRNRLLLSEQSKERAKSQLNHSKQQALFFNKEEKRMARDRSTSLRPPFNGKPKHKKVHTMNTTNTQKTIIKRQFVDFTLIPRTKTQQQPPMPNQSIIKFRNHLPSKTHNLINKIITNSTQYKRSNIDQQTEAVRMVNNKIIRNAVEQYQKIDRLSFKKLISKNHKNYIIKQPPQQYSQSPDKSIICKKPLKSYFLNS